MKLAQAEQIAAELLDALAPACERVEVAGSVRRRVPAPKDIEIVFVPRLVRKRVDLFTYADVPATDEAIAGLVARGVLVWDDETPRNGPKYKRLVHTAGGAVVELFAATPENWGLILALRTGPGEFNRLLVTRRCYGGAMPDGMRMQGGYLWQGLERLESPDEETFFAQMGIPCWPPQERSAERLKAWLRQETGG